MIVLLVPMTRATHPPVVSTHPFLAMTATPVLMTLVVPSMVANTKTFTAMITTNVRLTFATTHSDVLLLPSVVLTIMLVTPVPVT